MRRRRSLMWLPVLLVAAGAFAMIVVRRLALGLVATLPILRSCSHGRCRMPRSGFWPSSRPARRRSAPLTAVVPLRGRVAGGWVLAAIVGGAALIMLATPLWAGVVALTLVSWWALSRHTPEARRAAADTSALD